MGQNKFSNNFLSAQRLVGDALADDLVTIAFANTESKSTLHTWLQSLQTNNQLTKLPDTYAGNACITDANKLPYWADTRLMRTGAAFFARHAQAIMSLLGLLSLPYCYAAAKGAMVLYLSNRIRSDIGSRLTETAGFVWDVMARDAFEPEGKGFASCFKIRLTHATARYYILNSDKWNEAWGMPVNQEDMAGTNLAFSLIVIRGLRKLGYAIPYEEQHAFMHLWNVIGHLLGLQQNLLPVDGKEANILEEAIRARQFRASEQGHALTRSLLNYFSASGVNSYYSSKEVIELMRYLLGDEVADLLGLPSDRLPTLQLKLIQTLFFINDIITPKAGTAIKGNFTHLSSR